jgi:hypothetical protein
MDTLFTLLSGITLGLGFVALGLGGVVASPASSSGREAPPPARAPVMLVESDVRGGVRGILP